MNARRSPGRASLLVAATCLALAACGGGGKSTGSSTSTNATPPDFDFGENSPIRATAFGDSITYGVLEDELTTGNNYPNVLQSMMRGLDPGWRVVNRGLRGEKVEQGARRLPGTLGADKSGFALLMEGTNNATNEDDPGFIVAQLQSMVNTARGNRTIPVLGTIPPNFRHDLGAQAIINAANGMIRTMAQAERVVLAEIFNGMNDPNLFGLGPDRDPLHPNERGYSVMAGIWYSALQQALPAGTVAAQRRRR